MLNKTILYILFVIPFCFIFQNRASDNYTKINHTVWVKHPGDKFPVEIILTEVQNESGLAIEYYANVESVICLKEVCKVVSVKIYWNNIGEYQRYELKPGVTLEKYESDLFEPQDYIKLNAVLLNKNSPFKDVYVDDILTVVDADGTEGVDVISGATALKLDEKDTVPGAALTCYTLWHWANGNITSIIKKQTGKSASNDQLKHFLHNENKMYFFIALDELNARKIYSKSVIDIVLNELINKKELLKSSIEYLESAPSDIYLTSIKDVFVKGKKVQKLAVIRSLQNINYEIPKDFLDNLSNEINSLISFQEITRIIDLQQSKNPESSKVIENTLPLLDDDFIIARRAYWFLSSEKLNKEQTQKVNVFYENFKNKL